MSSFQSPPVSEFKNSIIQMTPDSITGLNSAIKSIGSGILTSGGYSKIQNIVNEPKEVTKVKEKLRDVSVKQPNVSSKSPRLKLMGYMASTQSFNQRFVN